MNDPELLHAYVRTRSESAFAELVQRHLTVVFFAALRQVGGDAHRAKDVSQIVFTELARKASTLVNRPTLTGWLYCTTRFAALHIMRAERRRERREQEAYVMNNLSPDSDAAVDWERLKPVVDDALHALNERDREAILLRFFHGRPFAEIGDNFGVTADAARFRVDRALARMRALLAERGITSTSAALGLALAAQAAASPPAGLAASVATAALSDAAATVGFSTSIGLLKIMTTAKSAISTVIALLCVAGLGEAWLAWSQRQELATLGRPSTTVESAAHSAHAPRSAASAAAGASQVNSPTTAKAASTLAPGSASTIRPAGVDPAVAGEARPVAANFSQAFTVAMNDPQFRRLLAVSEKARLNILYAPLFTKLNLSVDQIDHFKDLLVDKQQAVGDANRAALSQGMSQDAAYNVIGGAQEAINAEIRSLIGESGYAQYQDYEATRGQRLVVDRLRDALSYTSALLSDSQTSQLTQVLFQNSRPSNPPSITGLGAQMGAGLMERDLSSPITDQGLVAAQAVLSPPQLEGLRLLQQMQQERQRIVLALKPKYPTARPN